VKDTSIEWAHHSFNPWWGCTKISPGCQHCYAENIAHRFKRAKWGPKQTRVRNTEDYWRQPLLWQNQAFKTGVRPRVFCASMADVFDHEAPDQWRLDLWNLITATPSLDWLLLTKRSAEMWRWCMHHQLPRNVWLGITVENQKSYDERGFDLLRMTNPVVRFLSAEPMLGPINLDDYSTKPDWVICGGESGPRARPMDPEWVVDLEAQCTTHKIPFFFKQWGGVRKAKQGRYLFGRHRDELPTPNLTRYLGQ